ncbi:MAG: alpha/beta hydrolase [Rhodocyclaceae bacterium]|nr:MAG: alpha/beta hydrolase [Rhodocyclaceae bacterium]
MIGRWLPRLRDLLLRILLLMAMLAGATYFLQDRLLHYPEPIDLPAALAVARELQLAPWPDAAQPRGWLRAAPETTRGTVILFHGNGGHALHRSWYADMLQQLGYRTLLAEYPGYGHRSGSKDEATLAGDAAEMIVALGREFRGPLLVAGESLGAGVAAAALAKGAAGVSGVFLITPWDSLMNVASHYYPRTLVGLVLRDRYDSVANLAGYAGPKLVMLAGRDSIIPVEFGRNLYAGLGPKKKLVELPDADHNDWMGAMNAGEWQKILAFLEGAD